MDKEVVDKISKILEPTEEQKTRMFNNVLDGHKNDTAKKKRVTPVKRLRPGFAAALIAVCLIATTVFAASYMGLDINFIKFLNPSSHKQEEFLANGAYVVDKQVRNKNGVLDVKQVIGDSNVTLILMEFTASKGTVLDKNHYSFKDIDFDFGNGFAGYGIISLEDENINDNKINMLMRIKTEKSLAGQRLKLKLTDLCSSDTRPGELTMAVPGTWRTSFKLNFKNYSTDYQVSQEIKMFGYDAVINTVSISPISVTLKLESPFVEQISQAAGVWEVLGENKCSDIYPVTINYKDGMSETTAVFNGMEHLSYSLGDMLFIKTFDNVINDREIKSIKFFDTEVQIAP